MKFVIPAHVHSMMPYPESSDGRVLSDEYAQTPVIFFPSSFVHSISQSSPAEVSVFLLTSAITPCAFRILVLTFSFQSVSYASFTDRSMNSNGVFVFID